MNERIDWHKPLPEITPKIAGMEEGGTKECVTATVTIVKMLAGFPTYLAISALTNAVALVLAEISKTESAAIDETRRFRAETERCIRVNARMAAERAAATEGNR